MSVSSNKLKVCFNGSYDTSDVVFYVVILLYKVSCRLFKAVCG